MTVRIILLSGPLAVGKSAVADVLTCKFGFKKISTSTHLRSLARKCGLPETRETLQTLGDQLDEASKFNWLIDDVAAVQIGADPDQPDWFVDAIRKPEQVQHFKRVFEKVIHVHLTAPEDILKSRFMRRQRDGDGASSAGSYDRCVSHPNEQSARSLIKIADLAINLGLVRSESAAEAIARL